MEPDQIPAERERIRQEGMRVFARHLRRPELLGRHGVDTTVVMPAADVISEYLLAVERSREELAALGLTMRVGGRALWRYEL